MQIQKKFRHLDVKRFLNREFKSPSGPASTSRRVAIKQMSFILFGLSPLVKTLGRTLSTPFEIQKKGRTIRFILNKQIAWEINPDRFGKNASLKFKEADQKFFLELVHAEFPNSKISVDFKAVIERSFGVWTMDMRMPGVGINHKIPFVAWLEGKSLLEGHLRNSKTIATGVNDTLHIPAAPATLNNNWLLNVTSENLIVLNSALEKQLFGNFQISINPPSSAYWLNPNRFENVSWISLNQPAGNSCYLSNLRYGNVPVLSQTAFPFLHTGLVLGNAREEDISLLWACNEDGSNSHIHYNPQQTANNQLKLYRTRFIKEYNNGNEPFALVADLGDEPQWYGTNGTAFALTGSKSSTFTLYGENDEITDLSCQALMTQTAIGIAGLRSLPANYDSPAMVDVLPQDPVIKRTQTVKPGQVQTTGAIERVEPQERVNWIYVNKEPLRINLKIDKPILFNVIRPQDFLNLQFEFVNFNLDGNLLKIDNKKNPSFLIVHFPSQHTREQALRETQLSLPVKFKRAGNSRLVFKVPAEHPAIPLTLESLLDWRKFDLQVNYRARWFNTSQAISQIKETLSAASMVFSPRRTPADLQVKGAPVQLQQREVKTIKSQQVAVARDTQPMSALEVKVALASTPQGPGVMALTDSQLTGILATPEIELSPVESIRGAMVNLFVMQPPSVFETSIEAPTYAEVSPNQFAGFNHTIQLKDEFGEYEESGENGLTITDETTITPVRAIQPARQVAAQPAQTTRQTQIAPQTTPQTKIVSGVTVAVPTKRSYKNLLSPVVLNIPANIVLQQGQLFELWHSRMGIKLASGEVDEDALNHLKTIRVLWSEFANSSLTSSPSSENPAIPFNIPNPKQLHELVHLTSNYNDLRENNRKVVPQPVKANHLMLSGLGAWLNYEYKIDKEIANTSLIAWLQRATMGRDQFIKVIERGYLFPFGHKAVKITISERMIKIIGSVASAVMIYKEYIVVTQPELYYGKEQISDFVPFPFQRVEIKDLEKQTELKKLSGLEAFEINKVWDSSNPDPFKIELDDASGQKIRMEVPLVFVDGADPNHAPIVAHYTNNGWNYFTSSPANRPVAFARSLVPGDTTFETRSIMFGARNINRLPGGVAYYPEVKETSIYIKQMEELTGERKPVRIQLIDDNNLSMVFAKVVDGENASLVFGDSEKSGGLITPNMAVSGLSKLTGLTGNTIENLDKLMVKVNEIFSLADKLPKLFGIINFVDLLVPDVDLSSAINTIKSTIEQVRSQIESLQKEVMSVLARIDSELKKLDVLLQIIGNLLDQTDIIGALQDVAKLSQALEAYGVQVPGNMAQAVTATIQVGKEIKKKNVQLTNIITYVNNPQGLKNKLTEAGITVTPQLSQAVDQMLPLVDGFQKVNLSEVEITAVIGGLGLAHQLSDVQGIIKTLATQIADKVLQSIPEIPNVKFQIKGDEVIVEYHWKPKTQKKYSLGTIFSIENTKSGNNQIDVSVDSIMTKTIDLKKPPVFDVKASVKEFSLTIAQSIQLNFKKIEFKAGMSAKPDVDVKFQTIPIRLIGSLSFVNSLQSVIKSNQFESGPFIDITNSGVVAGYNFPIPNLEVGIFALSNMMLGVKVTLPFTKDPLKFGFNFCTRENPFKLMVSCFGGGGFFMMETTMQGLTRLDAAFEFGAGMSLNVGVASGSVEVMGGFYYTLETKTNETGTYKTQAFTAYIRMTGRLSIIGLIKVTLEFYLELRYEELGTKTTAEGLTIAAGSRLVGSATLSVKVEVLFFSKTVKVTVSRTLAGNDADPKFIDTYKMPHWEQYCAAFAS